MTIPLSDVEIIASDEAINGMYHFQLTHLPTGISIDKYAAEPLHMKLKLALVVQLEDKVIAMKELVNRETDYED